MLKSFFLFKWISQRLELKILSWLFLVCLLLIPIGSFISYKYAYQNALSAAELKVHQLVQVVQKNAAIAAYLSDTQLAQEIISGIVTVPEVSGVTFSMTSGYVLSKGLIGDEDNCIQIALQAPFGKEDVGVLDVYINYSDIESQAQKKGQERVIWELVFISTILFLIMVLFRILVATPIRSLVKQIHSIQIGKTSSQQKISLSSSDEFGFLAKNMNIMIEKIHDSYAIDKEKSERIALLEKQFRMIFDNSLAGIALLTSDNKVFLANESFSAIFGDVYESIYLGNVTIDKAFENSDEILHILMLVRKNHQNIFRDFKVSSMDDIWVRALFSFIEGEHQEQYVEMVVYDISDRAKKEQTFEYNASHDPLTGLLNRRGAEVRFTHQLDAARKQKSCFALVLIDLNKFKPVNDLYGHEAGDIVLKELSSRLRSVVTIDHTVIRWGGDEFIISLLLPNEDMLEMMIEAIQSIFTSEIEISQEIKVTVGASIGVSTSSVCGYDISVLIELADKLMYEVKRNRQGGYLIASSSDSPISHNQ
ncbi:diguanylate cyclase [Vibrio sp.]|nr:diguanylate cyclase [Vibrio sp.]